MVFASQSSNRLRAFRQLVTNRDFAAIGNIAFRSARLTFVPKFTFTGRENMPGKGYRVYGYDCSVDLNGGFAEWYMLALVNNYGFQFVEHFVKNRRRTSAEISEY